MCQSPYKLAEVANETAEEREGKKRRENANEVFQLTTINANLKS